jgi:hypothetical protein
MAAGDSQTKWARELDIRSKFHYLWRAIGQGGAGRPPCVEKVVQPGPQECEIAKLKAKIAAVERLNGQQAAELDFFAAALRSIELWAADITYLRLRREFVYLAVVLDVLSRRVAGWARCGDGDLSARKFSDPV